MKYKSVTTWQGEPQWQLDITIGKFDDIETAARFGNEAIDTLHFCRDTGQLMLTTEDGRSYPVQEDELAVSKLKPESEGKFTVDYTDYQPVAVKIEEFPKIYGLDGSFCCLAYGVVEFYS